MLKNIARFIAFSAAMSGPAFAQTTGTSAVPAPTASDAFVDSIGINMHLNSTPTLYYQNFPLIDAALNDLGIRHLRDSLIPNGHPVFYTRLAQLGSEGFSVTYTTALGQSTSTLQNFPSIVSPSFEGYEYPNETDELSTGLQQLKAFLPTLYNAANSGSAPNSILVGPSLTLPASYAALGDISQYFDYGNLHTYFGGRNPGTAGWGPYDSQGNAYGSLPYALDYSKVDSGNKPIYLTETGFDIATGYVNYVDETIAGMYLPRLLFETWNAGVMRTYIYELLTGKVSKTEDFGLLREDGSKRPGYYAIKNLIAMLADPGTSFTPTPLNYSVTGGDKYLHKLLLQKHDGTYFLALWVEKPGWEPDKHYRLHVGAESATVSLPTTFQSAIQHQWNEDGSVTDTALGSSNSYNVSVTDKIQIIELGSSTPASNYKINLSVTPPAGGSVSLNPAPADSTNSYAAGTVVNLTATPNTGYTFAGWSGFTSSTANSINVTTNGNLSLTASFACSLSVTASTTSFTASGGTATIPYTAGSGCVASPVSSASWLTASANANAITLVAATNTGAARTATVGYGGGSVLVTQAAGSSGGTVNVTLTTNVPGTFFYVDGVAYQSGTQLQWKTGDTHVFSAPTVQRKPDGSVWFYKKWDMGLTGAGTQTVTVPSTDTVYDANLAPGSYLITGTVGNGTVQTSSPGVIFNGISYYAPWQIIKVTAVPASGCSLALWKGIPGQKLSVDFRTLLSKVVIADFTCPTDSTASTDATGGDGGTN